MADDPKKLADSILRARARGKSKHDALVAETFEAIPRTTAGSEVAWKVLELADERACVTSVQSGRAFYEREVRVLGPVVAWRDSKVTTIRSLTKPGKVNLLIGVPLADAVEVGAQVQWGERPGESDLPDLKAHRDERAEIYKKSDVAALKEYQERYGATALLMTREKDGAPRQWSAKVWELDQIVQEACHASNDPKLIKYLLSPTQKEGKLGDFAISGAIGNAITAGNEKLLPLLLPLLKNVNEESFNDTLLAKAVRLKRVEATKALLEAKANPNQVSSSFGMREPFKVAHEDGNGPMVNAVRNGDAATLKLLLAAKGDPTSKTAKGRRVIDLASELGDNAILKLLGGEKGKSKPQDLEAAIATDNVERVLELIAKEGTAEVLSRCGSDGHPEVLKAVLESKAKKDPANLTRALWNSACNNCIENVKLFLKHGVDPNGYVHRTMGTPRATAVMNQRKEIAELLEKAGGKLRVKAK